MVLLEPKGTQPRPTALSLPATKKPAAPAGAHTPLTMPP
jgi:hypothetical protein